MSNFRLILQGQIYGMSGLIYSYPSEIKDLLVNGQYPDWINALPVDARFMKDIVIGGDCFSIRYNKEGLFYSYTRINPHDSRSGAVSVILYFENSVQCDAQVLIEALQNLADYFLEKEASKEIQNSDVEELVAKIKPEHRIRIPQPANTPERDAIILYGDKLQLAEYLRNPIQKEYAQYNWVHFVEEQKQNPRFSQVLYVRLPNRCKKCYVIKNSSPDIDVENTFIVEDDTISITYNKQGALPAKVNFPAGRENQYAYIDSSNTITIKSAESAQVSFKKRIKILVQDNEGNKINTFTINGTETNFVDVELGLSTWVSIQAKEHESKTVNIDSKQDSTIVILKKTSSEPAHTQSSNNQKSSDEIRLLKTPTIIVAVLTSLLLLVIGAILGKAYQQHISAEETPQTQQIDSLNKVIKSLKNDSIATHKKIENLEKDTANLNKTIQLKDAAIQKLQTSNGGPENSRSGGNQLTADQRALKYLNENDEWYIQGLNKAGGRNTTYTTFLTKLLKGDWSEAIKNTKITNQKWQDIVSRVQNLKLKEVTEDNIATVFKRGNTSCNKDSGEPLNPTAKLEDGTLNLGRIQKALEDLE